MEVVISKKDMSKNRIVLIYILSFMLMSVGSYADTKFVVNGCVRDEQTGQAVPFSDVVVKGTTLGIVTDAEGKFSLTLPAKQKVILTASALGYERKEKELSAVGGKQDVVFTLRPSNFDLDVVVVTGTRTEKALKDAPVITRVITEKDIAKLNVTSLQQILECELPGLEFTSHGGDKVINMQGMGGGSVLFLIDGERIAGETHANIDYSRIDPNNIERIEIVKGAGSALYGSSAIGGVVNIITKSSRKPFQLSAYGRYGSIGEYRAGGSVGTRQKKWSSLTSGSYQHVDSYTLHDTEAEKLYYEDGTVVVNDSTLSNSTVKGFVSRSVEQKFTYTPTGKTEIELKGGYFDKEDYNPGDAGKKRHDFFRDWNVTARMKYLLTPDHSLMFSYYQDNYDKLDYYLLKGEKKMNYRNRIYNPRLIYSGCWAEKHNLSLGAEFLKETLDEKDMFAKPHYSESYIAFVQDEYQVSAHWTVVGGLRLDHHSEYGSHLSPKLAGMFKTGGWTFRTEYAGGFRSPSLKELYTDWSHMGMFQIMGNDQLKPEKSHHFSLSGELTRGKLNASVVGYYDRISDKIEGTFNTQQDTNFYDNIGKATVYGIDVNVNYKVLSALRLKLAYAWVRDIAEDRGRNISNTRPHSATFQADYGFKIGKSENSLVLTGRGLGKLEMYTWDTQAESFYKLKYPAYMNWRLNLSSRLPYGLAVNVGVDNILNYKAKVATFNSSMSPGITFNAGISWNL